MLERGARVTVTGHDSAATVASFFEGAADDALAPRGQRRRPKRSTKTPMKAKLKAKAKAKAARPNNEPAGAVDPTASGP